MSPSAPMPPAQPQTIIVKQKGGGCLKIIGIVAIVVIVIIVGVMLLIGKAANDVQKDSDKHAITDAQFNSIHDGESKRAVEKKLGAPDTSQHEQVQGLGTNDCIYYNKKGQIISTYQFCFTNGKLTSKSSY